jgi:hypothetical protein
MDQAPTPREIIRLQQAIMLMLRVVRLYLRAIRHMLKVSKQKPRQAQLTWKEYRPRLFKRLGMRKDGTVLQQEKAPT